MHDSFRIMAAYCINGLDSLNHVINGKDNRPNTYYSQKNCFANSCKIIVQLRLVPSGGTGLA